MKASRGTLSGNSLVGILVAVAIILVLVCVFFFGSKGGVLGIHKSARKDNLGITVPGAVRDAALDADCQHNLRQIRLAIELARDTNNDESPASLDDLHLPASMLKDPIDHKPYVYDPSTGIVKCTHPGHENF